MTGPWRQPGRVWIVCAAIGSLSAATAVAADAGSVLSIRTTNQRTLTGQIDARTDADHLWIRQQTEHVVLATPVRWTSIALALLNGSPIEVSALAESAAEMASPGPVAFLAEQVVEDPAGVEGTPLRIRSIPRRLGERGTTIAHVASIEIDAILVNLDRDVEADGFEVAVAALDTYGNSMPVRGNLSAELVVERVDFHTGRKRFENVQRWNRPVAIADFAGGVARYQLPFRTVRPEFDLELRSQGLLRVRLNAVGHGNFAATVPVTIRPLNSVRDSLQLLEGSRLLRGELTERVRHRQVPRFDGGAPVWTPYSVIGVGATH